jgi:hypothetical protein
MPRPASFGDPVIEEENARAKSYTESVLERVEEEADLEDPEDLELYRTAYAARHARTPLHALQRFRRMEEARGQYNGPARSILDRIN